MTQSRYDLVLNAWAAGMTAEYISETVGIAPRNVYYHLGRGEQSGDPRAIRGRRKAQARMINHKIFILSKIGVKPLAIAAMVGRTKSLVCKRLRENADSI